MSEGNIDDEPEDAGIHHPGQAMVPVKDLDEDDLGNGREDHGRSVDHYCYR